MSSVDGSREKKEEEGEILSERRIREDSREAPLQLELIF